MNCFGLPLALLGQSRFPLPPAIMTIFTTRSAPIGHPALYDVYRCQFFSILLTAYGCGMDEHRYRKKLAIGSRHRAATEG